MNTYPPGYRISGQYEVASRPLMGGMGIVYLCMDIENDHPVALKTFKPEYLPDRAARDRFLREGTSWVNLGSHPHIVRCHGVEHVGDGREVYLVLELVAQEPGREDASLRSWISPGQAMPVEQALLFALQIARGMSHACSVLPGFVHRDLKPENVLVGADYLTGTTLNRLRVTDFGLAHTLEGGADSLTPEGEQLTDQALGRHRLTHGIVGTPRYMAPEQWLGQPVGVFTDVYALGCILYELLSGQAAVRGHTITELQEGHCRGKHEPLPVPLPQPVKDLVERCLTVRGEERFDNWETLSAALEQAAGQSLPPVSADTLSREERINAGWAFNAMGLSYQDIGKADVAQSYFERALAIGKTEGQDTLQCAALCNLGNAYVQLGDARRTIGYHEQALSISREIGDRRVEGGVLGNLGIAYRQLGDARRAIGFFEQALAIHRWIGNRPGEGADLGNLGAAYFQLGDARRAIGYHEQALAIHREIGDRRGEGKSLCNLGNAYAQLGDVRRAIGYFEQALAIHREIGDRPGEGVALGNLGSAYLDLGDARRAIGYYEQALAIDREIGDRRGEGSDLGNLGNAYAQLGDARRAIGFFEQALAISRESGDRRVEGSDLGNLGNAYRQLGDARRAIGFFEQALAISRESGDRRVEGSVLGNLGLAYFNLGDARRAIGYHEQALAIDREISDRRGEGADLGNLGNAYADLGDARRAIEFFEKALAIYREIGDLNGIATDLINMALLYAQQGDVNRALPLAQEAARAFAQIGHPEYTQKAQQLVAELQSGQPVSSGPSPAQILEHFTDLIQVVIWAAQGDQQARESAESVFSQLEQQGWRISEPIRRIWAGERDADKLTAGIDPNSALIIHEILKQIDAIP